MEIIGWIATSLSLTGIYLNARKKIACWPIWSVANVFWIIHLWGDWASVSLWLFYTCFNVYGYFSWKKDKIEKNEK
jgi:nicotinamide riboside transporter PnuC